MNPPYAASVCLFGRNLRLEDNNALRCAQEVSTIVYPVFIFDPRQCDPTQNEYFSTPAFRFLLESLEDLDARLRAHGSRLHIFEGKAEEIIPEILRGFGAQAICIARDYTPFAKNRHTAMRDTLTRHGYSAGFACPDILLHEPETVTKKDGGYYSVFTPFYRRACEIPIERPKPLPKNLRLGKKDHPMQSTDALARFLKTYPARPTAFARGGSTHAHKILEGIARFGDYASTRDFPGIEGVTGLSAHTKFGTISIRQVYWAVRDSLGKENPLLRQLYWRDFFTHVAFYKPYVFGGAFYPPYDAVQWENHPEKFAAWGEGRTGFPFIDAGMRQLLETGYMHNRARMAVASFLTKDLHIDWRWGEKHFARHLIDYDPCVNNGSWQWATSTGCDAQPYFRVFNPWTQQKKFDPEAEYIRRYVPELSHLAAKEIHALERRRPEGLTYPEPIVNHKMAREKAIEMFARLRRRHP